jgi:hypothetical protein
MRISKAARLILPLPVLLGLLSCSDARGPLGPPADPVGEPSFSMSGGRLLTCPTTETASATGTVGWGGGRIEVAGHELVIPKGAVLIPQRFRVEVRWSPHLVVSFNAEGHSHYQFLQPVTIKLNYSRCESIAESASDLRVYYVDSLSLAILEDVGGLLDAATNTVTAQTIHLSDYAVGSPQ